MCRPPRGGRGLKFNAGRALTDSLPSPSSRRAWIEIEFQCRDGQDFVSPSSRRAWIEIDLVRHLLHVGRVALLAEGVD